MSISDPDKNGVVNANCFMVSLANFAPDMEKEDVIKCINPFLSCVPKQHTLHLNSLLDQSLLHCMTRISRAIFQWSVHASVFYADLLISSCLDSGWASGNSHGELHGKITSTGLLSLNEMLVPLGCFDQPYYRSQVQKKAETIMRQADTDNNQRMNFGQNTFTFPLALFSFSF